MTKSLMQPNPGLSVIMEDMPDVARAMDEEVQRLSGKTVLITGANGFLASYLADAIAYFNQQHILNQPARLILLVRSPVRPRSRLAHLLDDPNVKFIFQDVCAPILLSEPIHYIVHAASPASPKWYLSEPVNTLKVNSVALFQLLELARHSHAESILYLSSSEVYGSPEPENIPTPETYIGRVGFTGGRACYIEGKRFGEALCAAYFEQYGVPVKIARPFHIHGPGLRIDDGRIVAELIARGLQNKPFELLSDGSATRTYGYVSDATVGFLKILLGDYQGESFNIGADVPETSILELATTIARLFGRSDQVKVNVSPGSDQIKSGPSRACPDLTKIRRLLGYSPHVALESGLERTIQWHRLLQNS